MEALEGALVPELRHKGGRAQGAPVQRSSQMLEVEHKAYRS